MVIIMSMAGGGDSTGVFNLITMAVDNPDRGLSEASNDNDNNYPSSSGSDCAEDIDLKTAVMDDKVTAQLAAAGPVGVAAAAAIVSSKKRRRPHSFETNPTIRKRQQNRLLRKLRETINEFTTRVGQQAVVLVATPGKSNYKVFGSKPLEDIVKNLRTVVMGDLENALAEQAPPPVQGDPSQFELPALTIDGIPTPVEKMTQAQLRAFIPLMLKYSTGRGKPGWGRETTRPPWWPQNLPWANVRMDVRTDDEKQNLSWTHALRQIVLNCYIYHGREDLLPMLTQEEKTTLSASCEDEKPVLSAFPEDEKPVLCAFSEDEKPIQYTPATLHTVTTNPDGTISLVQVSDVTTAHIQGLASVPVVQIIGVDSQGEAVDLNSATAAMISEDGQIILTGADGQPYPVAVSSVINMPVSTSINSVV